MWLSTYEPALSGRVLGTAHSSTAQSVTCITNQQPSSSGLCCHLESIGNRDEQGAYDGDGGRLDVAHHMNTSDFGERRIPDVAHHINTSDFGQGYAGDGELPLPPSVRQMIEAMSRKFGDIPLPDQWSTTNTI